MRRLAAGSLLLSLVAAGCSTPPERNDLELDPRPTLDDIGIGDEVSDSLGELGTRTMIPIASFLFFLPIIPVIEDPEQIETTERLSPRMADLLAPFAHPETDLFQPDGDYILVYAPRRDGARHVELIAADYQPALPGTEPGAIVAASARGVLHQTQRPQVYVLESFEEGQWRESLLVVGPADLVERKLLPTLTATDVRPVPLDTVLGPYLGVNVGGDPDLYALPYFDGAPTPREVIGVKPVSPAVWIVAYDTPAGRRWGPLTWSPRELRGPTWKALTLAPAPSLAKLLGETAPGAKAADSYLVAQREDGRWIALLSFAAPLVPATAQDFATPHEAVAAAEAQAQRALAEAISLREERAAEAARLEREAPERFDTFMAAGDRWKAREQLLHLRTGDSARWTRFVQTYGLEERTWDSQVDDQRARRNGVSEAVIAAATVERSAPTPAAQSDWDYFINGPTDGSVHTPIESTSSPSPTYQPPSGSAPTGGAYDDYYQKQYDDVIRRYGD